MKHVRVLLATIVLAALPAQAPAQPGIRLEDIRIQAGFSYGVFTFDNIFARPHCEQFGRPCVAPGERMERSTFGGGLWLAVDVAPTKTIVVEYTGFHQPWLDTALTGTVRSTNEVTFTAVGIRNPFEIAGGEAYAQMLFGSAKSERLPGGPVLQIIVGVDRRRSCGRAVCVFGFDLGYRKLWAEMGFASGWHSLVRVGVASSK